MNKIILAIGISIIFIAVFSSLSVLGVMVSKYEQCREHMFSETPQCNLVEFGQAFSSGTMLIGFMSVTSVGAAYILINVAGRRDGQRFYQSNF
ncbi:MAG: hypothetical protein FJY76_04350 [Candidatus Aenigmarchaeota archaeon]|nr:hypothetical protein [Candidatus Aenigmarchaeota archaeon]